MVSPSDLIRIPFTPGLGQDGIQHACRMCACNQAFMGSPYADRLRRIAARIAVELAFRHHLDLHEIPYQVLGNNSFADPGKYDVSLGGHRCNLVSYLISRLGQIDALQADPAGLLEAQALIPIEQFASQEHRANDIHLFAFLLGGRATTPGSPANWVHLLPDAWARPRGWEPLAPLLMKSESDQALKVQIGGLDAGRHFSTLTVDLLPRTRTPLDVGFHSLATIQVAQKPEARLGIHSPVRGAAYIIQPQAWEDVSITGSEIWLTGWLTHEAFRSKAVVLKVGAKTFQFDATRIRNLSVLVKDLNPCSPLFRRVKTWEADKAAVQSS